MHACERKYLVQNSESKNNINIKINTASTRTESQITTNIKKNNTLSTRHFKSERQHEENNTIK